MRLLTKERRRARQEADAGSQEGDSSDGSNIEGMDVPHPDRGLDPRALVRINRERNAVAEIETSQPLRRRLLQELAEGPSTPSALAKALRTAPETISRQLRTLRESGLVKDERVFGDGRRRRYLLTSDGATELNRHRAFGLSRAPVAPASRIEAQAYLRSALERAVELRRKANVLGEVAERLRLVLEQARKREANEIAVDALVELATTLRQDQQTEAANALIAELERISLGGDNSYEPFVVVLAGAHRSYALGRTIQGNGSDRLSVRATHLVMATLEYHRLSKVASPEIAKRAKERQAWSIASLASNLREQSQLEGALHHAGLAMGIFEELDDAYGLSYCLFLLGFCWRLQGDFQEAWQRLNQARVVARDGGYRRFEADTTMQMGEVRRCQGKLADARALLEEALRLADELQLVVTSAFARSALGAVEYQAGDIAASGMAIDRAQELFEECGHQAGLALNTFRKAVVQRRMLPAGATKRHDYQAAERTLADATKRYRDLGSSVGVAACEIEHARLSLIRDDRTAPQQIEQLIEMIDEEGSRRDALPLDPWLPRALESFAKEINSDELEQRAQLLMDEGRRRREEERIRQSTQRATPPATPSEARSEDDEAFAMGGETRLDDVPRSPVLDVAPALA